MCLLNPSPTGSKVFVLPGPSRRFFPSGPPKACSVTACRCLLTSPGSPGTSPATGRCQPPAPGPWLLALRSLLHRIPVEGSSGLRPRHLEGPGRTGLPHSLSEAEVTGRGTRQRLHRGVCGD